MWDVKASGKWPVVSKTCGLDNIFSSFEEEIDNIAQLRHHQNTIVIVGNQPVQLYPSPVNPGQHSHQ